MQEKLPVITQVSAGGVAYRANSGVEVALISVGEQRRWQLPKGLVAPGETYPEAAVREVREETGLVTELLQPLEKAEYWFYAHQDGQRVRIHKFVHFFLMRYLSGDVSDHDNEVNEARWVEIGQALQMLAFDSDRKMVQLAQGLINELV